MSRRAVSLGAMAAIAICAALGVQPAPAPAPVAHPAPPPPLPPVAPPQRRRPGFAPLEPADTPTSPTVLTKGPTPMREDEPTHATPIVVGREDRPVRKALLPQEETRGRIVRRWLRVTAPDAQRLPTTCCSDTGGMGEPLRACTEAAAIWRQVSGKVSGYCAAHDVPIGEIVADRTERKGTGKGTRAKRKAARRGRS